MPGGYVEHGLLSLLSGVFVKLGTKQLFTGMTPRMLHWLGAEL
jgi:hypothetical protein